MTPEAPIVVPVGSILPIGMVKAISCICISGAEARGFCSIPELMRLVRQRFSHERADEIMEGLKVICPDWIQFSRKQVLFPGRVTAAELIGRISTHDLDN
jgi:hypothetical protein